MKPLTAVIVDDEPLARVWLGGALEAQGVQIVGEGESGVEALQLCEAKRPDALFVDIRMPDLTGMEAAAALGQLASPPKLVFVTGHAEHAADAFERAAFDYLLKPVGAERLATTLARLRRQKAASEPSRETRPSLGIGQRLPVRTDYAIRLLRIEDIECALAHEKRVFIFAGSEELKSTYTLTQLEQILPPDLFMRIHASVIVHIDRIEQINFLGNHTYNARLAGGRLVPVGRSQYGELQRRLGLGT
jgi:DNA-binding LytR/AlgR family response regulator